MPSIYAELLDAQDPMSRWNSYAFKKRAAAIKQNMRSWEFSLADAFLAGLPDRAGVLDFGGADGLFSEYFVHHKPCLEIDLVDKFVTPSPATVELANIHPQRMGFEEWKPQPGKYDGIWSQSALFFVEPAALLGTLRRLFRSLKPGGRFFFTYATHPMPNEYPRIHCLSQAALSDLLERAGFDVRAMTESTALFGTKERRLAWLTVHATR